MNRHRCMREFWDVLRWPVLRGLSQRFQWLFLHLFKMNHDLSLRTAVFILQLETSTGSSESAWVHWVMLWGKTAVATNVGWLTVACGFSCHTAPVCKIWADIITSSLGWGCYFGRLEALWLILYFSRCNEQIFMISMPIYGHWIPEIKTIFFVSVYLVSC